MKMAKVVAVRFRDPSDRPEEPRSDLGAGEESVADCLRRYPRISGEEKQRLLRFLRSASRTEIRDVILRKGLEPRLIAFRKDHKAELRRRLPAWTPIILGVLLLAELLRLLT